MTWKILISSSKRRYRVELITSHKTFMNIMKSRGPKTDPCGMPESTTKGDERILGTRT
jgi:hypothetical protein